MKELEISCSTLFDMRGITFADEMGGRQREWKSSKPCQCSPSDGRYGLAGQDAYHRGKFGGLVCPAQA